MRDRRMKNISSVFCRTNASTGTIFCAAVVVVDVVVVDTLGCDSVETALLLTLLESVSHELPALMLLETSSELLAKSRELLARC